jgi:hypothetical protein
VPQQLDHLGHLAPFFNPLLYCLSLVTSFSFSLNESNFLNSQFVKAFKNDDNDVVYANFDNNDEHNHKTLW